MVKNVRHVSAFFELLKPCCNTARLNYIKNQEKRKEYIILYNTSVFFHKSELQNGKSNGFIYLQRFYQAFFSNKSIFAYEYTGLELRKFFHQISVV